MNMRLLAAVALLLGGALRAEPVSLELILDCSASMWNKLEDGRYRIDGAKAVLSDFIATTPERADLHVGLRIYGSRVPFAKDGACADSVLVTPLDGFRKTEMLEAVRKARAVGATPLARSLELAKEDFNRPGQRRLIIFTDGEESCGGDVQAALAALKAAGVDVDVRLIGIGLGPEATRRFEAMGLRVENANSARALATALSKAAELPAAPQAKAAAVVLRLIKNGAPFAGATPKLAPALKGGAVELVPGKEEGVYTATVQPGAYTATVGERRFEGLAVTEKTEPNTFTLDVTEAPKVALEVEPAKGGQIGAPLTVRYKGAAGVADEFATIAPEGAPDGTEPFWAYTSGKEGAVEIRVHGAPGRYEARFITKVSGQSVLAGRSTVFELEQPKITLTVPESVPAATNFTVQWSGPASEADWIGWLPKGAPDGDYNRYHRLPTDGSPVTLLAPPEPGEYEVRYGNDLSPHVLARTPLKVVASTYGLTAPESAMAGTEVEVSWNAPKTKGIYITIVPQEESPAGYYEYTYTEEAPSPVRIQAPRNAGPHEVRIVSEADHTILHKRPIALTEMQGSIKAPATGKAGQSVEIRWSGPNGRTDYITLTRPDADPGEYTEYFYTRDHAAKGSAPLTLPAEPGEYEIRYIAKEGSSNVLARQRIRVE